MKSKLPNIGATIFTQVSALAVKYNAINLGQGFPDFEPDPVLLDCVQKSIVDTNHQYAPMAGYLPLREILAEHHQLKGENMAECITISAGGTQAIYTAISAFVDQGDEVIVFEPVYDCYIPAIELHGGRPKIVTTYPPFFDINWEEVASAVTESTKMIIINTPNNPSGKMWRKDDFQQLSKIIDGREIMILSDEVYEDIIIDKRIHISPYDIESLRDRTISIHSLGKVLGCTGWKIGYIIANETYTREFRKVHQYNVFCVNSFLQVAMAEYFSRELHVRTSLGHFYTQKYNLLKNTFSESHLKPLKVEGGFFQVFNYEEYSLEDDVNFNEQLIHYVGVAGIPLSAFYPSGAVKNKYIRFCFAKKNETIISAANALDKLLIRMKTI